MLRNVIKKIVMVEDNIKTLHIYDLSYFKGRKYFDKGDGKPNYLVFLPMRKYFKLVRLLVLLIVFYHGDLKEYLMKVLNHLHHLIMVLIQN